MWLQAVPLAESKRTRLDAFLRLLDSVQIEIKSAEATIQQKAKADAAASRLTTIPGIGFLSALTILAEIGDISRFTDAAHLVSFAGLAPRVRSSGGRTKLGHITKQGPSALRWLLIEATHIAVRKPGWLQDKYLGLRRGKSSSVAVSACARELLVAIYHVLMRGEAFGGHVRS